MFSLCIPTMDRYDTFLKVNLEKYLKNPYISEIIITDETGNDYDKIIANFNDPKLKVFKNDTRLGPFLNKLKVCKLAINEWIVLMDSDNYADENYFKVASDYIKEKSLSNLTILAPSYGSERLCYTHLDNKIICKNTISYIHMYDTHILKRYSFDTFMNIGNYVLNKCLIDGINIENEFENIKYSSACDVIYFNTLLFEQFDGLEMHVVSGLHYEHISHDNGIYITTFRLYPEFNSKILNRFYNLGYTKANH